MAAVAREDATAQTTGRFGTFAGVFTPNILTILGIILFLRMGWVVGQAGLFNALIIVAIANAISLLTGLSLSAIATNMRVKAGGNYYIISRSLGLEIGGAIGIPLYLSQAISVAFYIIGFTEALLAVEFFQQFDPRLIASAVALAFVWVAYIGADFALRIQFFILAVLIASLISFFLGAIGMFGSVEPIVTANFQEDITFWMVFAVFFPAVTGIEVGVSLSGDLKDPSRNIPIGTIASILFTAFIYILVIIVFAYTSTPENLIGDNLAMQRVALVPQLILAGVWASTLSSALGSVLAAPRTLQAIARDRVVPYWMSAQMGSPTEPRMAVLLTGGIALAVIWAGDLDAVAPVISMFFLNTYGMVNLTAALEKLISNPSYRPRFKIPWYVSLLGALGCYSAMFLINPAATVIAIIVSYGFFALLQRRQISRTWGDARSGIWFALARYGLMNLEQGDWSPKNWRPNIIVFTGQPHNREQLVAVAQWLSLGRGIVTFFQLIVGDVNRLATHGLRETAIKNIRNYIEQHDMMAFAEADIVADFHPGALTIVQSHGVGGLSPNTVLMGWSGQVAGRESQLRLLRDFVALKKSVLFLNYDTERDFGKRQRINVWWQGRGGNEDLMLLLAHLIEQHSSWRDASVYLMRIVESEDAIPDTHKHMATLLERVRVEAEPIILVRDDPKKPIADVIAEYSQDADFTLLGMNVPDADDIPAYAERLEELASAVGSVLLVRNAVEQYSVLETD